MAAYSIVGKSVQKIDALSLATGTSRYTDDFELKHPLHLKLLYSPHAHAGIIALDDSAARRLPGVIDVFHFQNVQPVLHTTAGQGYPEPSPYDTVLFDHKVRFIGDRVAMVAADSEAAAIAALGLIRVDYQLLPSLFDPQKALEPGAPQLHDTSRFAPIGAKYDPQRNLAAEIEIAFGDLTGGEAASDFIIDETYQAHYASHCAIEPHAAQAFFDEMGRLVIISSTQVPFHARRIVAKVCDFPVARIRVIKPRIGGGFGAKQEVLLEPLVALAALKHKRPAKLVLSRREVFQSARTRHPVRTRLRTGVDQSGRITFLEMDSLLNSGAYGTHALTVLSNCGAKVLPLFNKIENLRFLGRSVYTNLPVGGAYRGYGATQGYFALNQQIDIITRRLGVDLIAWIKQNHIREGETSRIFEALGEGKAGVTQNINSCKLDECLDIGAHAIGWYAKRNQRLTDGDKVRGVGLAIAMQGSAIPLIDMASAYIKMNDDGSFNLDIGATDIGTGSDTVLAQIAAEVLSVSLDKIIVLSSDTDQTPFDVGAYASSTTYLSGGAVKKCAEQIRQQILAVAARLLACEADALQLRDGRVVHSASNREVSFAAIAEHTLYAHDQFQIQAGASHVADQSPPPFCAQFAEVEVDRRTGRVRVLKFVSAVDCGQAIHPQLTEGQIEGAVMNGISYALTEEYRFATDGNLLTRSFRDYKIWTTADLPEIQTFIIESHEKTGPFGAKSVAEIGINGPLPAIANAIYDAVGVRLYEAPFTPPRIYHALQRTGVV